MGLDTSHDCWHGSYGSFGNWRRMLADAAGLPPLNMMEGHFDAHKFAGILDRPIAWHVLKPDVLHELLNHSDCDGELKSYICKPLADRLEELLDAIARQPDGDWYIDATKRFIKGLRLAASKGENVEFR